jgi:prepilin-type N-terminal cleavage/methylation domain-containing protein
VRKRSQVGFTLIEVIVAMALSGLVALGVHAVFASMTDAAALIGSAGRELDTEANKSRLLHAIVEQAETAGLAEVGFGGDSTQATFSTWCLTPKGLSERCIASLVIVSQGTRGHLLARLSTGEAYSLLTVSPDAELRYLSDRASGSHWTSRWARGELLPRAIGIMSARDTIILRIGDRG